jgi:hypothetical protein
MGGTLTMPRTEESKLTSQSRRSSPALRMTGRDPERPRRAAIADMSIGRRRVLVRDRRWRGERGRGAGLREAILAFWRGGRNSCDLGGRGIVLAGEGNGGRAGLKAFRAYASGFFSCEGGGAGVVGPSLGCGCLLDCSFFFPALLAPGRPIRALASDRYVAVGF